jgi:NTP pyrophosphatase (non-canonical NTP hydrolase)
MLAIQEEVADILIYLLYLSHDLKIDLKEAIINKMVKNAEKYPVKEYFGKFHDVAL